jgi:hypothetical protein
MNARLRVRMSLSPRARRDVVVVAATFLLCIVLLPGAFSRGEMLFERDLNVDWYLRLQALTHAVRDVSLPLWDDGMGFGQPLLADPGTEVLYPPTWLALAVPRWAGYTVFVVLHLLVAAVGTERLAESLGTGRTGAVVAALLFVLSGPIQSAINLRQHLAGAALMPWVLLAADRCVRRPTALSLAALALAGGLQVLAGSADLCAMTWTLCAGLVAFRMATGRRAFRGRRLGALVAAAALAVGLTAVVWWPATAVLARSPRHELPEDVRTAWSVPLQGLLRVALPLDPGAVPFTPETWTELYDRASPPFLSSLYLGLPVLAVAGLALVGRRRSAALFLGVAAAAAMLLAMGPHGPLYPLATTLVPPLRIFRYPSKATLVVALAVSLLAGLGVGALARGAPGRRARAWAVGALLAATALALLAATRYRGPEPLVVAPALAVTAAVVLALGAGHVVRPRLVAATLSAVCVADLLVAHAGLHATGPEALLFEPPETVRYIDTREGRRLYVYDYHSVEGTSARLLGRPDPYRLGATPRGWEPRQYAVAARQLYLPPPAAALLGIPGSYDMDIRGLYSQELTDLNFFLRHVEGTPAHTTLLRLGAVGTVLSLHDQGLEGLELEATLPSLFPEAIRVRRVPRALPRSWVVSGARVARGREAFETLADVTFDPAREVLLAEGSAVEPTCELEATSRVVRRTADRVRLEVQTTDPGFVVLADAFDPGWRATVDGAPAPVLRANVAFRAVPVPAGRHLVEMVYRPDGLLPGLILSGASLLALLALVVVGRPGRARPARVPPER